MTVALVPTSIPRPITVADPKSVEATEALGEQIAALAMQLHAATYELLVLLREFDQRTGWHGVFASCAHWLHSTPTRKPRASGARAWRRVDEATAAKEAEVRHLHRHLSTWTDEDGMVVIRGRLTPEVGAAVQRALDAACDRLRREGQSAQTAGSLAEDVTPAQRRADALGMLAEAALSANLDRGNASDRYQVMLHIDSAAGVAAGEGLAGTLEVGDGAVDVSADTSRRISCDASLAPMRQAAAGAVLDVGREA